MRVRLSAFVICPTCKEKTWVESTVEEGVAGHTSQDFCNSCGNFFLLSKQVKLDTCVVAKVPSR